MTRDDTGTIVTSFDERGIKAAQATMRRAHEKLNALCSGTERWHMSVPAQLDRDPDLVIGEALFTGDHAITEVERLRDVLEQIETLSHNALTQPFAALARVENLAQNALHRLAVPNAEIE